MRRRFVTLDVFTFTRFAGNPLAVVFESDGLDTPVMQAIAREFNFPETVFVLPPAEKAHRAGLRIFTPTSELPFAGHPTVGAAMALARGDGTQQSFVVEEKVGLVPCDVTLRDSDSGEATFALPQLPMPSGDAPQPAAITAALGLESADIAGDFPAGEWSAGVPFMFVQLRNLAAIAKASPQPGHFERAFARGSPGKVYLFCRETAERGNDFHARMFAPGMGIPEDPATGSAVAAFGGLLATQLGLGDGEHLFRVEQGYEMRRPSGIALNLTVANGKLVAGKIGGGAVVVAEGVIEA